MAEYLFRDVPPFPLEVVASEGSYLISKGGKRYLDFVMGWCVGNAGWNRAQIVRAVRSFRGPNYVLPDYRYPRWEELAQKLVSLLPRKRGACFRATGGTEAVELGLKIARAHNHRKRFIALSDAYHGQSLACMGLVGLNESKFGPYPGWYSRLNVEEGWEKVTQQAVRAIRKKEVCALISEPIVCNLGVVVPPKSFFAAVAEACKATDTLLIMDEVATGFGRTGRWFGFEHHGIEPDIITIAKGFSSGYAAIGATIAVPEVAEAMRFSFSNYSTFGWHPLSTEVALANIEYIQRHRLVEQAERSGEYLMKRLSEFCKPEGKGLCIGFDVRNPDIQQRCFEDGLLIAGLDSRALLFPALDIGRGELERAIEIIKAHY